MFGDWNTKVDQCCIFEALVENDHSFDNFLLPHCLQALGPLFNPIRRRDQAFSLHLLRLQVLYRHRKSSRLAI